MITSYATPSYLNLREHVGQELAVVPEPCRLVTGTVLVLEDLSTPWEQDGLLHFEARFTGPAGQPLSADFYRLRGRLGVLALHLEPIARDLRYVHYAAALNEPVAIAVAVPLAG